MGDTRLVFLGLQAHLDRYAKDNNFSQHTMAALIYRKIEDYWMPIIDSTSTVSAILDPRSKLSVFSRESKSSARARIQSIYELYKERVFSPMNSAPPTPIRRNNRQYFALLRQNVESTNEDETSTPELESESELSLYLEQPMDEEAEPLLWWKTHSNEFPVLSKMARDYLTIQATSVASESSFSIAGNTITKTRNRLLPETARACLCSKSWMDKGMVKI
jgi:hypothetical protein